MYQIWQASIIWFLFLSFGIGLQGPCVTVQAELSILSRRQTKQKFMQNQVKSLERKSLLIFFIFVFLCWLASLIIYVLVVLYGDPDVEIVSGVNWSSSCLAM